MLLVGELSYNGIYFGAPSHVTLSIEPVRDDADRTTIYCRWKLSVRSTLYSETDTGPAFQDIRTKLVETGKILTFKGQGVGDIAVNTGSLYDVKFGPKPRLVAWAPVGSLRACEVQWECEFCLPACYGLTYPYPSSLLAFNFKMGYSIDLRGRTTRRIEGYIEIPLNRLGSDIPDCADNYRGLINPIIPSEFQRTQQDFNLSLDKSRLDFTIVDEEIPSDNPYPLGVARIDARHSVNWVRHGGMAAKLTNRVTVSIEMQFNQPTSIAYDYFVRIVRDRVTKAKANAKSVLIQSVNVEEGIYDRTSSFSCTWIHLCERDYQAINRLRWNTGIFSPLASNPTWSEWNSVSTNVSGPRGYMGLKDGTLGDKIIDLCVNASSNPSSQNYPSEPGSVDPEYGITNEYPNSDTSWVYYRDGCEIIQDSPTCRQSILQEPREQAAESDMDQAVQQGEPALDLGASEGTPDVIQTNGQPRFKAIVIGYAERAGYEIPCPNYPQIGEANTFNGLVDFEHWQSGTALGVPLYCAMWTIEYELDKAPGKVGILTNVEQGPGQIGN